MAAGKLVAAGFVIGALGAVGVTPLIATQLALFGIGEPDPLRQVGVGVLLAVVALIACTLPACRAAKVTPIESMR